MKIRYKYSRLPNDPVLESLTYGLIKDSIDSVSEFKPEINVSFEAGKHGNRIRIRLNLDTKCIIRISASGDSIREAIVIAVNKLKVEINEHIHQQDDMSIDSTESSNREHFDIHEFSRQRWSGYLH